MTNNNKLPKKTFTLTPQVRYKAPLKSNVTFH